MNANALFAEILANPADDVPRLIYADWLDEHDNPDRADFIRTQCQLARLPQEDDRHVALEERERKLYWGQAEQWRQRLPAWARKETFKLRRGFVAHMITTAARFLKGAAALYRVTPLESAWLSNNDGREADLAACPYLARLRELELSTLRNVPGVRALAASTGLANLRALKVLFGPDDAAAKALADSPHLGALQALHLHCSAFGPEGLRALRTAAALTGLAHLILGGTPLRDECARVLGADDGPPGLLTLDLTNTGIGADGAAALAAGPRLAKLTTLDLSLCPIGPAGARVLAGSAFLSRLARLDLQKCNLGPEGALPVVESAALSNLTALELGQNDIGAAGAELLRRLRLPRLRCLGLSNTGVGDDAVLALAASACLAGLEELDLGYNRIGPAGARALASSPAAARLRKLDLSGDLMDEAGARALVESPHLTGLRLLIMRGRVPATALALLRERFGKEAVWPSHG
jgi:uncharacterized protein (TIGR02996 family)